MKKSLPFFILLAFCLTGVSGGNTDYYSPENILRFADYLYQEGDYLRAVGEYQRYMFLSPQEADSVLYKIGLCYRLAGDTEKAINCFRKIIAEHPESQHCFDASYQIAYSYFISGRYQESSQYLDQILKGISDPDRRGKLQILAAFNYLHQRRWREAEYMLKPLELRDEDLSRTASDLMTGAKNGLNLPRRNPAIAALLSAIVPGTGRMYCKQYGDGFYSLILIGVTGLLAWNGFQENGVRSIRGWFFGSMSGVFYAGNVYGSSIAARIYNRQLETDLIKKLPAAPDK